jgi:hypothetical protein
MNQGESKKYEVVSIIVTWGAIWGIFEAVVGYFLHLISFPFGWLIWYPAACFFLANVCRKTGSPWAVFSAGVLCASVKLLNLLLPGRIDQVMNPAISIVFEALMVAAAVFLLRRIPEQKQKNPIIRAFVVFGMNTGWRLFYVLYLLLLAPDWIRDVSVIQTKMDFTQFFVVQNLITGFLLFFAVLFPRSVFRPIRAVEKKMESVSVSAIPAIRIGFAAVLLCAYIALQLLL